MKKIFIFGSGDLAKEIFFLIKKINFYKTTWQIEGFVNDKKQKNIYGYKVDTLTNIKKKYKNLKNFYAICGVMNVELKKKILKNEIKKQFKIPTLIDPDVFIPTDLKVGKGSIILSNVSISYDVKIDDHTIISAGTVLGHGVKIGKNTLLAPGCMINGNTKIGSNCILNSGVQTLPRIIIGNDCTIGLGTSVFKNLDKKKTISNLQRIIIHDRK